jgi:hypothetical protein
MISCRPAALPPITLFLSLLVLGLSATSVKPGCGVPLLALPALPGSIFDLPESEASITPACLAIPELVSDLLKSRSPQLVSKLSPKQFEAKNLGTWYHLVTPMHLVALSLFQSCLFAVSHVLLVA